jgi:hypothetical protein
LFSFGLGASWIFQDIGDISMFLAMFAERSRDILTQEWLGKLRSSSRYYWYSQYKVTLETELYLLDSCLSNYTRQFTLIRMGMAGLAVDVGRHANIDRSLRICAICSSGEVEDEYHFIIKCQIYEDIRKRYIPIKYTRCPFSFVLLMSCKNVCIVKQLQLYIHKALKLRENVQKNNNT